MHPTHPIIELTELLMRETDLPQDRANALVRRIWDAGVAEGTRRMMDDLAAANRENEELRRALDGE
ncbi:hypothetical protein B4N89_32545 [Embleya scabrispora]|uniref:Uncharacterized protein n=1 Tax=Embleya scabrispora TaxID=159449 RepID=A0A1T3NPM3_9ACTN|nr:hypothetical protein [Embleya scabrispora]OPC78863.1 hypothetical protein B4N89_32545 [Embleya scabrispora]